MQVLLQENPAPFVRRLTLNRPSAANALNAELAGALAQAMTAIDDTRCILLAAAGSRAFCAGADLKERAGMDRAAWAAQHQALEAAVVAVRDCPVPVVAVVQGAAFGGGCELALAADFILAAKPALFALPEAGLGIMPGMGGTQALPRRVGPAVARDMLLTGEPIAAIRAFKLGMVSRLYSSEDLARESLAVAQRIAGNAPRSLRAIKAALRAGEGLSIAAAMDAELAHYTPLIGTQDQLEGIRAFAEKRAPKYSGN